MKTAKERKENKMEKIKNNGDSKTLYKVTAYIEDFNSTEAKEVYCGEDREIAIEYVRGYSRSGIYVHLVEISSEHAAIHQIDCF